MGKIAFIFPGQGSQYVGMGRDFYENSMLSRNVYKMASQVSGLNIENLCFKENNDINITEYTQIAMITTEVAMLRVLEDRGIRADVTAGLSLGEYGALVASGVMTQEDVFKVVRKRGIYMQNAVPKGGAMVAVLGMDTEKIEAICNQIKGEVSIANYNCPGQIVITGEERAIQEAVEKLSIAGARKCVKLNVSGPFHSMLLQGAGEQLAKTLEEVELHKMIIPYLTNVTADYVTDLAQIKELLKKQVYSSVKWQQTIEKMLTDGVDTFIEIGPGKTLTGFLKKIVKGTNHDCKVYNLEKWEDIEKIVGGISIC